MEVWFPRQIALLQPTLRTTRTRKEQRSQPWATPLHSLSLCDLLASAPMVSHLRRTTSKDPCLRAFSRRTSSRCPRILLLSLQWSADLRDLSWSALRSSTSRSCRKACTPAWGVCWVWVWILVWVSWRWHYKIERVYSANWTYYGFFSCLSFLVIVLGDLCLSNQIFVYLMRSSSVSSAVSYGFILRLTHFST